MKPRISRMNTNGLGFVDTRNQRAAPQLRGGGPGCRHAPASKLASRAAIPAHPRLHRGQPVDFSKDFQLLEALSRPGAECLAPTNVGAGQGTGGSLRACSQWDARALSLAAVRGQAFWGIRANS